MKENVKEILSQLQYDLPIVANPYRVVADKLNMTEDSLLASVNELITKGYIRKVGAVLSHRKIGYFANALCVWQVPEASVVEVGMLFAGLDSVTHCYERVTYSNWPYNLYTMIHAADHAECEGIITQMRDMSGISEYRLFYSSKELKKTSMHYF